MPAYVIVEIETEDAALMAQYRDIARPIIEAQDGRYLARGGRTVTLEGGWSPERLVVLEFPTVEQAEAWWRSADYAEAKALRQRAGRTRMVVVEGM